MLNHKLIIDTTDGNDVYNVHPALYDSIWNQLYRRTLSLNDIIVCFCWAVG
jgi:hypothetical protein